MCGGVLGIFSRLSDLLLRKMTNHFKSCAFWVAPGQNYEYQICECHCCTAAAVGFFFFFFLKEQSKLPVVQLFIS